MKVGLALGGGGSRGLAHLGVIAALVEAQIPIHAVAGTSVGSVVGAAYCAGIPIEAIMAFAKTMRWHRLVKLCWSKYGFLSFAPLEKQLDAIIGGKTFADLAVPFSVVATDMLHGETIAIRDGAVATAVRASSSVPGVIAPVEWNGRLLSDGGLGANLPVDAVRELGAEYVIGVELITFDPPKFGPWSVGKTAVELMLRASGDGRQKVDCLIEPQLNNHSYVRLVKADALIEKGRQAANAVIPQIKAALA